MFDAPKRPIQIRTTTVVKRSSIGPMEALRGAPKSQPVKVVEQEQEQTARVVKKQVDLVSQLNVLHVQIQSLRINDPEFADKAVRNSNVFSDIVNLAYPSRKGMDEQTRKLEFLLISLGEQSYKTSAAEKTIIPSHLSEKKPSTEPIRQLRELSNTAKIELLELIQSPNLSDWTPEETGAFVRLSIANRLELFPEINRINSNQKSEIVDQIPLSIVTRK